MAVEYVTSIDDYKKLKEENNHLVEAFKESADNYLCFEYLNRYLVPRQPRGLNSLTMWCVNLPSYNAKTTSKKCPVLNSPCARI